MLKEFDIIEKYFSPLTHGDAAALALKDDAALLSVTPGHTLVVTTDAIVTNTHFFPTDHPADIARKLLRVNLSDLAAMGAFPKAYLLTLMLPKNTEESWLNAFASALEEDSRRFHVSLIGGDTVTHSGLLSLSLTMFGEVPSGKALRRSVARPGDRVFVSGTIGDSALGLKLLKGEMARISPASEQFLISRYLQPQPRVKLGQQIVEKTLAYAAMDISDGLVQDAGQICKASGVGIEIDAARVPLSEAAKEALKQDPNLLSTVLTGGDDYELLFTVPAKNYALLDSFNSLPWPITEIGVVTEEQGVRVLDSQRNQLELVNQGYEHVLA